MGIYEINSVVDKAISGVHHGMPRIALVVDSPSWAFANIANSIKQYLSEKYDISIFSSNEYGEDFERLFHEIFDGTYDIVHFFWREILLKLYIELLRKGINSDPEVICRFVSTRITFSVYDHCLLGDSDLNDLRIVFKYFAEGYVVSSERLFNIYNRLPDYPKPFGVVEDGVDLNSFRPANTGRLMEQERPLVVGWAGNSQWGKDISSFDFKGFRTIIRPALKELQQSGFNVVGKFADRNDGHIPYERMVDYYNSIDIYVCASSVEGTPNPVLEAMACGLPVISTDVGIVPQLFGREQKKYILNVRCVESLKKKLVELIEQPEERVKLSCENLKRIVAYTREVESAKWDTFFENILACDIRNRACKQACLEIPYTFRFEETVDRYLKNSISWKLTQPLRLLNWHARYWKNRLFSDECRRLP